MGRAEQRHAWLILASGVALFVASCGEGAETGGRVGEEDASSADVSTDALAPITSPTPPALTPCPDGWLEVAAGDAFDVAVCEPWPSGARESCGAGQAHFPGEPGCAPVGSPCPDGVWPADLPTDRIVRFVQAGAPSGGTGSQEQPLDSLAEALLGAAPGTVIALAKGTFTEAVVLPPGVELRGACAAETVLRAPDALESPPTIAIGGTDTVLRDLALGGPGIAIQAVGAVSVEVAGVLVTGAGGTGIEVAEGAAIEGRTLVVRDITAVEGAVGIGLYVSGGSATLDGVIVEGSTGVQVGLAGAQPVHLSRVAISDVVPIVFSDAGPAFPLAVGLIIADGSEVELAEAVLECHGGVGLLALGENVRLTASDVLVRGTGPGCDQGQGVVVTDEATGNGPVVDIERVRVSVTSGIAVGLEGGSLTLRDAVLGDTAPFPGETYGGGIVVRGGAAAAVERAIVRDNVGSGVVVFEAGSSLAAMDLTVTGTLSIPGNALASSGIAVAGGHVELSRFVVDSSALCGLQIAPGGAMDATEGVVSNNVIGVNIQVEGFNYDRISSRVALLDNELDFDAASLPVPDSDSLRLRF